MTAEDDDRDLREAFSSLRRDQEGRGPGFVELWRAADGRRGASHRRPALPALAAASALAAAALVALALRHAGPSATPSAPPGTAALSEWTAPTDFLLRTPGREILETLPSLGRDLPAPPEAVETSRERSVSP